MTHRGPEISIDTEAAVAVRAQDLRRAFGHRVILDGVDLEVERGSFVAILGHSGTGKTTLLRALAGLDGGSRGSVVLCGQPATVFQDLRLLPWKSVEANVALGCRGPQVPRRVAEVLADVELSTHASAWPATLSGGEAARVALARALVRRPGVLLLDEPFGPLDALTRFRMHELMGLVRAKYAPAVVMVTHDVDEAMALADRVLVLDGGRFGLDEAVVPGDRHQVPGTDWVAQRLRLLSALGLD
jgi:sulfonate transport system ATP-binding protein